jgi:replicative DNA helicase
MAKNDIKLLEQGYVPPQATDIETVVLGVFMMDSTTHEHIASLNPDCFYKNEHALIFNAIAKLYAENKPIDILTVSEKLQQVGNLDMCGGRHYITSLTNRISSGFHTKEHVRILLQKWMQRKTITKVNEISKDAYSDMFDDMVEKVMHLNDDIVSQFIKDIVVYDAHHVMQENYRMAVERYNKAKEGKDVGLRIPLADMHRLLGGWQKGDLIIMAGRPSMGKTSFALFCARHLAKKFTKICFFSLEMNRNSIMDRIMLAETGISAEDWRSGSLTMEDFTCYENTSEVLKDMSLSIIDRSSITPNKIKHICKQHKPEIVFIDYLQLMSPDIRERVKSRNDEVGQITRSLKGVAKDMNIPIVLLCQLNRQLEQRANKIPMLSDLRDSGEIEQDADIVVFLSRPSVYDDTEENKGKITVCVAKHRNGRIGLIDAHHDPTISNYFDTPIDGLMDYKPF